MPQEKPRLQPREGVRRLADPILALAEIEGAGAILLVLATAVALIWANLPFGESYQAFWHLPLGLTVGSFDFRLSLEQWVNDALMAVFFLAVGLEIKREMVLGELSKLRRAMLPLAGAFGGMVVPAGIYVWYHLGGEASRGWGIPMATDIAFAVAALAALGRRVPASLKIFLLALAIVDDIGAVLVIALFYTDHISLEFLAICGAFLGLVVVLQRVGVRAFLPYWIVGAGVWFFMHESGVHATIAGVLLGLMTPVQAPGKGALGTSEIGVEIDSPLDVLLHRLERLVTFGIMPVFALANAGVVLDGAMLANPLAQQVGIAVALGLVLGKPIGITFFAWLAVRLRIAEVPSGLGMASILGVGALGGIGFTMALFVTALAFDAPIPTAGAKVGILVGSLLSFALGVAVLHLSLPREPAPEA